MWLSPMMDVKSSGAELPAAMNVAPATSSLRWRRCEKLAQEDQKVVEEQRMFRCWNEPNRCQKDPRLRKRSRWKLSYLAQLLQGRDKVVVTHNSQSAEHIYSLERESQIHCEIHCEKGWAEWLFLFGFPKYKPVYLQQPKHNFS